MSENRQSQDREVKAGSDAEVKRVTKQQEELDAALVQEHREQAEAAAAQDEEARNHLYPASHLHTHDGAPDVETRQS